MGPEPAVSVPDGDTMLRRETELPQHNIETQVAAILSAEIPTITTWLDSELPHADEDDDD